MKSIFVRVIFIGMGLIVGCQPGSRLTVQSANGEFKPSATGFFYSLPRTIVEINIELQRDIYIPGPYCEFAAQFLGIEGIKFERKEEWSIISENLKSYSERDPDHIFYAGFSSGTPVVPELLKLSQNGLIFSASATYPATSNYELDFSKTKDTVWYTDLSMDYFYSQKTDTLFKTVLRDSSFIKIPVLKKEEIQKSDETKAKEAANAIIKLRKRRFKLLTGEYNFITEGAALEVTVRELNKMEQEYIALFLGKHFIDKHKINDYFIPGLQSESDPIFRFSKEIGIVPKTSKSGMPISMHLIKEISSDQPDINIVPAENSLYFRLPENAIIQLNMNNKIIVEQRIAVYQFGRIQIMPITLQKPLHRRFHL